MRLCIAPRGFDSLRSPQCAGVVQRIEHFGPNEEMPVRFRPPVPVFRGRSPARTGRGGVRCESRKFRARARRVVRARFWRVGLEHGFPKPRPLVRFQPLTPNIDIRGLGKRCNPLGLGPRESRFESEVPDQFLWGSQAVRRLAVNQFIRRFESCPHSQNTGVAFWREPLSYKQVK